MFFDAPSGDFLDVSALNGTPAPLLALLLMAAQLWPTAPPSGITASPLVLLLVATQLWPTTPPVPLAAFARAYSVVTETPLSQKNHQK